VILISSIGEGGLSERSGFCSSGKGEASSKGKELRGRGVWKKKGWEFFFQLRGKESSTEGGRVESLPRWGEGGGASSPLSEQKGREKSTGSEEGKKLVFRGRPRKRARGEH